MRVRALAVMAMVGAGLLATRAAEASNVSEFPDNGSEQMGRGGAWIARASDPLAAFYNPAGLAGQDTKLTVQINLPFVQTCFTRVQAVGDTTPDALVTNGVYPKVCNDLGTFPTPSIGFNWRVAPRLGLALLLTAPNGAASSAWPEFVADSSGKLQPAPERYLLTYSNALFITPTIGVGWEPVDNLRVGASFQWGIASATFSSASIAVNGNALPPASNDVKATLTGTSMFVPGFTLGALWSAAPMIDVGAWFKWSAPIEANGDVKTYANYYNPSANVVPGNTAMADCIDGKGAPLLVNGQQVCHPGAAYLKLPIPMEAKIGFRLHKPRSGLGYSDTSHRRDPMSQDVWDVETDFTWANDSAMDNLTVRFPSNPDGTGQIPVNGTGGDLPPNADIPHYYNDVFGVRVGGDYNVIPDRLAVRVGGFFESQAANSTYQNIDFAPGARVGLALGSTLRIPVRKDATAAKGGLIELSLGYMHVFVTDLSNNDPNSAGLSGLAGTPCNGGAFTGGSPTNIGTCGTAATPYRTNWPVNLGTITNSADVINLGASYRF